MSMQNNTTHANTGDMPGKASFHQRLPLLPLVLMGASALVALVIWTVPNLGEFVRNAAQFPLFWQIAGNRWEIIRLVVTVFSPVILALLVGACCWLWYTIRPFLMTTPAETGVQNAQQQPEPATIQVVLGPQAGMMRPTFPPPPITLPETPVPPVYEEQQHDTGDEHAYQVQRTEREQSPQPPAPTNAAAQHVEQSGAADPALGSAVYVVVNLLGEVSMTVQTADGTLRLPVLLPGNAMRVQLLAYIAWQQGKKVHRDKMLEDVFGHRKSDEEATPRKLSETFQSHRKLIRLDVRTTIGKLNAQAGLEAIPAALDIFANSQKNWWLAETCRVADLEIVKANYRVIEQAENGGLLANSVPEHIRDACESLIAAYKGDFLENLLRDYPYDFDPWTQSWARKPFTLYRDYLLDALWYAAGFELQAGQALSGQQDKAQQAQQNRHYDRAARHYRIYAMSACSSRFDLKVSFSKIGREHGERVTMSERALRRCLMLYGAMGSTYMVDKIYSTYYKHMRRISAEAWKPAQETLADLEAARSRTSAYRLSSQIAPSEQSPATPETVE